MGTAIPAWRSPKHLQEEGLNLVFKTKGWSYSTLGPLSPRSRCAGQGYHIHCFAPQSQNASPFQKASSLHSPFLP